MIEKIFFKLDFTGFSIQKFVQIIILFLFTFLLIYISKRAINRSLKIDQGRKIAIHQILKYFVFVISAALFLQIIDIDVSLIIASSAALLVGLGMGVQNLFNDLVSGFIVLLDGTVKVGDVIELEGMIGKVKLINLRTTTVETRDDKNIILPNSSLTNKNLINWTHSAVTSRFEICIGVDYNSDVKLVMEIIKQSALANELVLDSPDPFVRLIDFGDSAIKFQLFFWTNHVFRVEQIKSDLRVSLFEEFIKQGITIPFPQRVLHIKN